MTKVPEYTERLLGWLAPRLGEPTPAGAFTNEEAAVAVGMPSLTTHGVAFGNVVSRIDFACYRASLPPVGLLATKPFKDAWSPSNDIVFPVAEMQHAARLRIWTQDDFSALRNILVALPGQARSVWADELATRGDAIRAWAFSLLPSDRASDARSETSSTAVVVKCAPKSSASDRNLLVTAFKERAVVLSPGQDVYLWFREDQGGTGLAYKGHVLSISDSDPVAIAVQVDSIELTRPLGAKNLTERATPPHSNAAGRLTRTLFARSGDLVAQLSVDESQFLSEFFARSSSDPSLPKAVRANEKLADSIRAYIVSSIIEPARANGRANVEIRAGDIHGALGLKQRVPAVCSVLTGQKLADVGRVMRISETGPSQGPNCRVTFSL